MYSNLSHSACVLASSMCMQGEREKVRERKRERETYTHTQYTIHNTQYTSTYTYPQGVCAFTISCIPKHQCDTPSFTHTLYIDMNSRPRGLTCKRLCIQLCLELIQLRIVLPHMLALSLPKSCPVHVRLTMGSLGLSFSLALSLSRSLSLALCVFATKTTWKLTTRAARASERAMAPTTARACLVHADNHEAIVFSSTASQL